MKKTIAIVIITLLLLTALIPHSTSEEPEGFDLDEAMRFVLAEHQDIGTGFNETNLTYRPFNSSQQPDPNYVDYMPGEVIIGFKLSYNVSQMNTFLDHPIINRIEKLNIATVQVEVGEEESFIDMVEIRDDIYFAELNTVGNFCDPGEWEPNDPGWIFQWNLNNIKCPKAWDIEKGMENVVIAIIDTGIDFDHPDLKDNIWINPGEDLNGNGVIDPGEINGQDDDGNGYIDDLRGVDFSMTDPGNKWPQNDPPYDDNPKDTIGHGTSCAGIAAAQLDNDIGMAGIADVGIVAIRVNYDTLFGPRSVEEWIAHAIMYAADLPEVYAISMSFGNNDFSDSIATACYYAYNEKNCLLVASSGNKNENEVLYPGKYSTVISVGATDQQNKRWKYAWNSGSNYGDELELMAPGTEIISTMPTYEVFFNGWPLYLPKNYVIGMGTSASCPHVAGVAALYFSKQLRNDPNYEKNSKCCRCKLQKTALNLWLPGGWDKKTGYGLVQADDMVKKCVIYVEIEGEGSVSFNPDQATYAPGLVVQLTANPSPGRPFIGWEGDLTSTYGQEFITLDSDKCITAVFG